MAKIYDFFITFASQFGFLIITKTPIIGKNSKSNIKLTDARQIHHTKGHVVKGLVAAVQIQLLNGGCNKGR